MIRENSKICLLLLILVMSLSCTGRSPSPEDASFHVQRGMELFTQRHYAAIKEFEKALALNPNASECYPYMVRYYQSTGMMEYGQEFFDELADRGANNVDFYFWRGYLLEALSEYGEAELSYRNAIRMNKSFDRAYAKMADMFIKQKKYDQAINILDEYLSQFEKTEIIMRFYGKAKILNGDFEEGESIIKEILKTKPDDISLYNTLAMSRFLQKDYPEAEKYYRKVIAIDPENSTAHLNLGRIYLFQGKHDLLEEKIEVVRELAKQKKQ